MLHRRPLFLINREIRRVPLDWEHPRDQAAGYIPLQNRNAFYTSEELQDLLAEGHTREAIERWFMPDFSTVPADHLGLCVYETTTEGIPQTPIFSDTPEGRWALVHYCASRVSVFADQMVTAEAWTELLFGNGAALDPASGRLVFPPKEGVAA
jgi:hypothetical protein